MSLDHRLKLLINSKKISQSEFARKVGITRATVNQWLSGKLVPGHKPLLKIFNVFPEVSADWLLLGKGEMSHGSDASDQTVTYLKKQLTEQEEMISLYKKLIEEKDARLKLMESMLKSQKLLKH